MERVNDELCKIVDCHVLLVPNDAHIQQKMNPMLMLFKTLCILCEWGHYHSVEGLGNKSCKAPPSPCRSQEYICNIMKCCHLVQSNTWSSSSMLAWMPSGNHVCLQGGKHACAQTMLYEYCSSIDELFWFNANLRPLVTLILIIDTLPISSYFSLIFLFSFSSSL